MKIYEFKEKHFCLLNMKCKKKNLKSKKIHGRKLLIKTFLRLYVFMKGKYTQLNYVVRRPSPTDVEMNNQVIYCMASCCMDE